MAPFVVDEPDGVEDLHRLVRVERRDDLRDCVQVSVEEFAQPPVVVDRARAGASSHEQLEAGDAEGVLDVHGDQADPLQVVGGRAQPVLESPGFGLARALLVRHAPDLADGRGVEVGRNR